MVSICLLEVLENKTVFKYVYEDEEYAPTPWGFWSPDISVTIDDEQEHEYMVICINYDIASTSHFKLRILST
jgi:hypothetical protein